MKQAWNKYELHEHWSLADAELKLANRTERGRLGFAVLLKFFQFERRFPGNQKEIPNSILNFLAKQLQISPKTFFDYDLRGRSAKRDRSHIRSFLGFRRATVDDSKKIIEWLCYDVLNHDHNIHYLQELVIDWCRKHNIEPPTDLRIKRIINSASHRYESDFFKAISEKLSSKTKMSIDALLEPTTENDDIEAEESTVSSNIDIQLNGLKSDVGRASLKSVISEINKLNRINKLNLPENLLSEIHPRVIRKYRQRVMTEPPRELRRHPEAARYTLMATFCWKRKSEIIDGLIETLIQLIHRIGTSAEKKVVKTVLKDLRKVHGKTTMLYKVAEVALDCPNGIIKDVVYPIINEKTLADLVKEYKSTGPAYQKQVHTIVRGSYSRHYRRMFPLILDALEFHSNNEVHRPIINALSLLKSKNTNKQRYFSLDDDEVPIEGVVRSGWQEFLIETDKDGIERINRINYEIAVLQALREKLRCKEIWVKGADRFRNPDDDVPSDFKEKRTDYYSTLNQPTDVEDFVSNLKKLMSDSLAMLNKGMPRNKKVKIVKRKKPISLSPLDPQPEPVNLAYLKVEITKQWPMTGLLDVLKEAELCIGFSNEFKSVASREVMDRTSLQKYLLLCLYGLGTNTGLKRVSAGDPKINYKNILYVRRRFITKENLRNAIIKVVNALLHVRRPDIWGEGTTACASDSKKFGAWDQNLMTEWHVRYFGRGVMIYWHVDRKSACIYSQLKRCSSSEVAAMIEGVLRHCTEMEVEKNYVDSHGQSLVAFAFCYLLGFELLPRLKAISSQKLYLPDIGMSENYPNLKKILTRPINWDLIRKHYDEMIKYATALRLGTAEPESILRRFTRDNLKHPTYQALLELGKAVKTIFLCRYLHSEALRCEINEGLNVIENWNGANDFIYYGKGREFASNKIEDQEISVLSLHLLQNCLVYINTLMIQNVLADPQWMNRLGAADFRGLNPLIHNHINPYGIFKLDMEKRMFLDNKVPYSA